MENRELNLDRIVSKNTEIIDYFLKFFSEKDLDSFCSKKDDGEILSFRNQLLIRYKNKYPIYKLEKIKEQLYCLSFSQGIEEDNVNLIKEKIFKELDKLFTDKKPNKFLNWIEDNKTLVGISATILASLIPTLAVLLKN